MTRSPRPSASFFAVRLTAVLIAALLAALLAGGCDKDDSGNSAAVPSPTTDPSGQADASAAAPPDGGLAGADAASAAAIPTPTSPLVPARPNGEVSASIDGPVYGTFQGEVFGESSSVYGVVRLNCGAGTILQPIFRRDPEADLEVAPPIPLQFYGLQTERPVTYEEEGFRVTVDFDEDSPDKLKGEFSITYDEGGEERVYARLTYDGPPMGVTFPPKMKGDGKLPVYPDCFPTGYYELVTSDGETVRGLTRVVDVDGRGVPFTRILVGDKSALQLMALPRDPSGKIDPPRTVKLADARRTSGDLAVLIDAHHRPELIEPSQAIGANLGTLQESKVLKGEATVRVFARGKATYFEAAFKDVEVSSIIDGPLSGKTFETIRIYGELVRASQMPTQLPAPPEWWGGEDQDDDDAPSP